MIDLTSLTKARLDDVVVLSQKNRKPDENPGAKLSFDLDLAGDTLAALDRRWPDLLWEPDPDAKQGSLTGLETDRLTNIGSKIGTIHWEGDFTGWQLTIDRGTGGKSNIVVRDCVAENVRITPKAGRAYKLKFSLDSSDVSETDFGRLAKMKSCDVQILLARPMVQQRDLDDDDDHGPVAAPAAPARKPGPAEKAAVANVKGVVKYRDKATGSTWSGRGLQPTWLKVALTRGMKLSDFEDVPAHKPTKEENLAAAQAAFTSDAKLAPQDAWPFPKKAPTETAPQSVTTTRNPPQSRTARGRDATKAALAKGASK